MTYHFGLHLRGTHNKYRKLKILKVFITPVSPSTIKILERKQYPFPGTSTCCKSRALNFLLKRCEVNVKSLAFLKCSLSISELSVGVWIPPFVNRKFDFWHFTGITTKNCDIAFGWVNMILWLFLSQFLESHHLHYVLMTSHQNVQECNLSQNFSGWNTSHSSW